MTAIPDSFPALPRPEADPISKPPSGTDRFIDRGTRALAWTFAVGTLALLLFIIYEIGLASGPALKKHGLSLIASGTWDVNREYFGLRSPILGTLYSSALALIVATIFGVAIAIFLSQNFIPRKFEILFKNIVELLAAIPSVVYGLWGIFVVIPLLRAATGGALAGPGMLPAALVLAIMILPTISAISYDTLISVNPKIKEAAYGLGATRWEAILRVILPTASTGIFGSVILGFGRALGETMALAMLLGNVNHFSASLFAPGNTLAALIANDFPEAGPEELQVLLFAGMTLLAITLVVNVIGAFVIQFANPGAKAGGRS